MNAETSLKVAGITRFGRFELDRERGSLRTNGCDLTLRPKTFALLSYLAAHPDRLISKAELMDAVWPGVVVTDDSLTQCAYDRADHDDAQPGCSVSVASRPSGEITWT
ncbi:hypothetical protein BH11PSE13_BH11PSE13_42020 [soil metagenome]